MICPRHCTHSVYSRPRYGLVIGRSSSGHVTLPIVSSRHCRWVAICSSAGCHMAACESPTRATVVDDAVAADAHSSWPTYSQDRTQPLTNTSGLSTGASASEGVRLEGTAWISADAATAVWTWAVRSRTAASSGSTVGVLGAAAAAIVGAAAAAPRPTGTGTTVSRTRPAAAPAAVTLP